jgi:hypothetical protein
MRRWSINLGLMLGSLLIGLVIAETAVRLIPPFPSAELLPLPEFPRRIRRLASGEAYVRFDQELGWVTTPGVTRRAEGVAYTTNRAGQRSDRDYPPDPPAGFRRLVAFGDSYTYCHEVNNSDCWAAQLERSWPHTEVLNHGVPGYGPDQAWLRFQRDGTAPRPCAVTIGFMVENVNRVVNRFRPFLVPDSDLIAAKPRFVLDGDRLTLLPNPVVDPEQVRDREWVERELGPGDAWYVPGALLPSPFDAFELFRVARTAIFRLRHGGEEARMMRAYREQNEAFELSARILAEFARDARARGIAPVVLVFIPANRIEAELRGEPRMHAPLLARLEREGVPVIDLSDRLVAEARRGGIASVVKYHYTPIGNAAVADELRIRLPSAIGAACPG